jgi:hypothetical protein
MKVYVSGVVHGSRADSGIESQEYRERIREILAGRYQDVEVVSPLTELDQERLRTDGKYAEETFFGQINRALTSDVVVAFLPQASMGAAIEIWEAYKNSRPVVVISPLQQNWVVRFLSTCCCPDLDGFASLVASGELDKFLLDRYKDS